MNKITFFVLVGALSIISIASGVLGYLCANLKDEKEKHNDSSTFCDLYEDNAPKSTDYVTRDKSSDPWL